MDVPNQKGETKRQRLKSVVRQTGGEIIPDELKNNIKAPSDYRHVLDIFWSLSKTRSSNELIKLDAIENYIDLYKCNLNPFEIDTLIDIDRAFVCALMDRKE